MNNIKINCIKVTAKLGTSLGDCIRNCIELAGKEWQNVELIHNETTYEIKVCALADSVNKL